MFTLFFITKYIVALKNLSDTQKHQIKNFKYSKVVKTSSQSKKN